MEVFLEDLKSLEVLDLSQNQITVPSGLEALSCLRVVNLTDNPNLAVKKTLELLVSGELSNLEEVSLAPDSTRSDGSQTNKILMALILKNPRLALIDRLEIDIDTRVNAFTKLLKGTNFDPKMYRINCALYISACPKIESFLPDDVGIGKHYNCVDVTELLYLGWLRLLNIDINFGAFINLEKLSIAHNHIDDITAIGIGELKKLTWLDIRNNNLKNSASQIGSMIDRLTAIEVIALAGNPCMNNKGERLKILRHVKRLQELDCPFRVLDTEITVAERVQAWTEIGSDLKVAPELMGCIAALKLRSPAGKLPAQVLGLDLSGIELPGIDLQAYSNLRKLNLSNNKLFSLEGSGIANMRSLMVLNLQNNCLSDMNELVGTITYIRGLEYIGIGGNNFGNSARRKLLNSLPIVRSVDCTLRFIDSTPVTLEEILEAIKDEFVDEEQAEHFKFDVALRRCISLSDLQQPDLVTKLNLSSFGLTYIQVGYFTKLEWLDLSNNRITFDQLQNSGVDKLSCLRYIDLSTNHLIHVTQTAAILSCNPNLSTVFMIGNKSYPVESEKHRIAFLKGWQGIATKAFSLVELNGVPIGVEERLEAVHDVLSERDAQKLRLEMHLIREMIPVHTPDLSLSGLGLAYVDAIHGWPFLQRLNLSNNKIVDAVTLDLVNIPSLVSLDLRQNSIETIKNLLDGLKVCHRLREVYIHMSTKDGETKAPDTYLDYVGRNLRGITMIDDLENPHALNSVQRDAQDWLYGLTRLSSNNLRDINIAGLGLPSEAFFFVLMALREIGHINSLHANENLWNKGGKQQRIRRYREFCIAALSDLAILDDERILEAERLNALRMIDDEAKKGVEVFNKAGWIAVAGEAKEAFRPEDEKDDGKKNKDLALFDPGAIAAKKFQGVEIKTPEFLASAANGSSVVSKVDVISGSVLSKLEIFVHFIQIYSLTLTLDVGIPWPSILIDISEWTKFFTFDFDKWFNIDIVYQQQLKFAFVMGLPFYFYGYISLRTG